MITNHFMRILLGLVITLLIVATGSVWHKDDQCVAGVSDTLVIADSIIKRARDSSANEDQTESQAKVVAYYFHTTYRCVSCKKIEAYSREAIETGFAEELKNGKLKFESINIQEDENEHFIKDYQLYTKSLVICNMENGKQVEWKNLAKVWQLLRNKDAFVKYVQDEISAYLKES